MFAMSLQQVRILNCNVYVDNLSETHSYKCNVSKKSLLTNVILLLIINFSSIKIVYVTTKILVYSRFLRLDKFEKSTFLKKTTYAVFLFRIADIFCFFKIIFPSSVRYILA